MLLNIETSTDFCSVALNNNDKLLFSTADERGQNHASLLSDFVQKALNFAKSNGEKIDAIAVSAGPGSYTGLRIGIATAKGLCFGLNVPMIAVDTLQIMNNATKGEIDSTDKNILLCPMIDARRMEVYCALYNFDKTIIGEIKAEIITENSFAEVLKDHTIYFFGTGIEKCKTVLKHSNCRYIECIFPFAENMISLSYGKFQQKIFEDIAYFEPFYLKEFQATKAKNFF
ncbi:MAG: tRNA (adenosine(37)-N6)-threonylcarbamoyltransferase complex dimerization subunit type 1 TsaB [Paludibacter sp.]|nr:tRNA (adenosine(37)-N6)-threonylcarbamoyltransferase complex dimerization subunit type 1 TsaB [Paludibacter sp.]